MYTSAHRYTWFQHFTFLLTDFQRLPCTARKFAHNLAMNSLMLCGSTASLIYTSCQWKNWYGLFRCVSTHDSGSWLRGYFHTRKQSSPLKSFPIACLPWKPKDQNAIIILWLPTKYTKDVIEVNCILKIQPESESLLRRC